MKAGIVGGSGYTGVELLRLLAGHPEIEVARSPRTPTPVRWWGSTRRRWPPPTRAASTGRPTRSDLDGLDLVFCALPHGESQRIVPGLRDRVGVIVDLAADFRLRDPAPVPGVVRRGARGPALLGDAVYGLPELFRGELAGARSSPPPAATRPPPGWRWPRWCGPGSWRPAGSSSTPRPGVSGAGRAPTAALHFGTVDEDFVAYGLLTHRHTPEMRADPGRAEVLFTPHLAPMVRGILATCYARPAGGPGHPLDGRRHGACCTRPTTPSRSWW